MDPAPDPSKLHYLGPDINISAKLIGATVPLIFLSTLLCALRIYTRIRPIFNWGWDDSTISMSWVS